MADFIAYSMIVLCVIALVFNITMIFFGLASWLTAVAIVLCVVAIGLNAFAIAMRR